MKILHHGELWYSDVTWDGFPSYPVSQCTLNFPSVLSFDTMSDQGSFQQRSDNDADASKDADVSNSENRRRSRSASPGAVDSHKSKRHSCDKDQHGCDKDRHGSASIKSKDGSFVIGTANPLLALVMMRLQRGLGPLASHHATMPWQPQAVVQPAVLTSPPQRLGLGPW